MQNFAAIYYCIDLLVERVDKLQGSLEERCSSSLALLEPLDQVVISCDYHRTDIKILPVT